MLTDTKPSVMASDGIIDILGNLDIFYINNIVACNRLENISVENLNSTKNAHGVSYVHNLTDMLQIKLTFLEF